MKTKFFPTFCLSIALFFNNNSFGQKKVVIMGSSTAYGAGASSYQLSWAGLLESYFNTNTDDGIDTSFYNIATPAFNTYLEMPSSYVPPVGRPNSNPSFNVTKALSYSPDVVIVSLPSNDVGDGFTIAETMNNLRFIYNSITASGAKCYITTSQPRNDYSSLQRQDLLAMADSINNQFGLFSINFWDDLVTSDGLNMLRIDRKDPTSLVHPNDIGHNFLFERVRGKNIFGIIVLPIKITGFTAQVKNNATLIAWHIEGEEPNSLFEIERSAGGVDFEKVCSLSATQAIQSDNYSTVDKHSLAGNSFYRIKVTDYSHNFYSNTIRVTNKCSTLNIDRLYKDNNASNLIADVSIQKRGTLLISIVNVTGIIVVQKKQYVNQSFEKVILPIANLSAGQYFLKVTMDDNSYFIKSFIK